MQPRISSPVLASPNFFFSWEAEPMRPISIDEECQAGFLWIPDLRWRLDGILEASRTK